MLSYNESLKILKETNALLDGHFILSSGLHSSKYIQCAQLLSHPSKVIIHHYGKVFLSHLMIIVKYTILSKHIMVISETVLKFYLIITIRCLMHFLNSISKVITIRNTQIACLYDSKHNLYL